MRVGPILPVARMNENSLERHSATPPLAVVVVIAKVRAMKNDNGSFEYKNIGKRGGGREGGMLVT